MTDIVLISLEPWGQVWRRNQYLVREFLRAGSRNRVLFVEPAADPLLELTRGRAARRGRGLRPGPALPGIDRDRLWLFEPTKTLPRKVDARFDEKLALLTRRIVRELGMSAPILWANAPSAARLVELTGWPALYDITDDRVAARRPSDEHRRLLDDEALLLSQCAEVVVCSERLAAIKGVVRPVTIITNGVDLDRYRTPTPRPKDLPDGANAVYVGTVHPDRFDSATTEQTADRLGRTGTVVLVGPVAEMPRSELAALTDAGVRVLGARPWDRVPAYLQHATVLIAPHRVDNFTDSLDPIKLHEYRAVGHPIVSTLVGGFRDCDDPQVHAVERAEFAPTVVRLMRSKGEGPQESRLDEIATWKSQGELMVQAIARTAAQRSMSN